MFLIDPRSVSLRRAFAPAKPKKKVAIKYTVSVNKISWALNSVSPFKSPDADGIFPALFQDTEPIIIPCFKSSSDTASGLNTYPNLD